MVDWGKLKEKALDVTKQASEKGVESFKEWKNDPERLERKEKKKAQKVADKEFAKEAKNHFIESDNLIFNDLTGEWSIKKRKNSDFHQSDLLAFELMTNDKTITKGGVSVGRAAVGNLLIGPAGLVLGGLTGQKKTVTTVSQVRLQIKVKNSKNKIENVDIWYHVGSKIKTDSAVYSAIIDKASNDMILLNKISGNS